MSSLPLLSGVMDLLRGQKSFRGGAHPPQCKDRTQGEPIKPFPFAPVLNIPLSQHIGKAAKPVVRQGQEVHRGELLAKADGFMSVDLHAPATGTIQSLGLMPSISGQMLEGIYLKPFPSSTQEVVPGVPCQLEQASANNIINAIQAAGIVGLGGAAFPTHVKLQAPVGKNIDTLVINGAECEPYLTNDHRVMLEQSKDVVLGTAYLLKATGAARAVIGIESNKPDAVQVLQQAAAADPYMAKLISVETVATKYPQGAEKMLIQALLGRSIPPKGLPSDVGVVGINVTTAAEIGRLLPLGRGIMERVITISGPAIERPGNYRIPIGTPLRFALEQVGVAEDVSEVYLGGPMMGQALPSLDISITKGTSGFLAFGPETGVKPSQEMPCIHCAYCVDACPMGLNPSQLGILARNHEYQEMASKYHLLDCFECGTCAFVCPSRIPLVQSFRAAKKQLKRQDSDA